MRDELKELRNGLLKLHGVLLSAERGAYERENGAVAPAELLQMLLHDERFQWLRPLSGLVADIDGVLDAAKAAGGVFEEAEVAALLRRARATLAPEGGPDVRYQRVLQEEADAIVAHADVVRALRAAGGGELPSVLN